MDEGAPFEELSIWGVKTLLAITMMEEGRLCGAGEGGKTGRGGEESELGWTIPLGSLCKTGRKQGIMGIHGYGG